MDSRLAKEYVEIYYQEKKEGLYVIPMDGPVTFLENVPYKLHKNEKGQYYLIQENENVLYGKYKLTVVFEKAKERWIIIDIKVDHENNLDESSPENKPSYHASKNNNSQNSLEGKVVLINKSNAMPVGYVPSDLTEVQIPFTFEGKSDRKLMRKEAAIKLKNLFEQAAEENIKLYGTSGYRAYKTQKRIFNSNVSKYGSEAKANRFSAYPGQSEHQTGLAMDITSRKVGFRLIQSFGDTPEGKWLAKNASDFGFIIRYPKGKEDITGYSYEPWHLRYVGLSAAKEIANKHITLEEYHLSDARG